MGTIWIKEFTGGLDTRRMPETTSGGTLIKARDGHINRGGEFEQRAAFVPTYTLPANTIGLAAGKSGIYVFGSGAAPAMPIGVTYQRLQHPDGVTSLSRVLSSDLNAGKLYVVAEFTDGTRYHYYDGARVTDWQDGRARCSFAVTAGGPQPAVSATASFTVATGSNSIVNTFAAITVNGVALYGAPVQHTGNNSTTATAIANAINSFASTPEYTAAAVGALVTVTAAPGAATNGFPFVFTLTGDVGVTGATSFTGGLDAAISSVADITVNGVSILSSPITWAVSHAATAAAIADNINNYFSTPDYTATSVGATVNLLAADAGTGPNGFAVAFTLLRGFAMTPGSAALANGLAPGSLFQSGSFAKTIGSKMYAAAGPAMNFSGVAAPTSWQTSVTGAGFIDMSSQAAGSEELTSLGKYLQYVAVFAARVIQIWFVDPDPSLNKQIQVLSNTGTGAGRSVTQFGDTDLFFLDDSGLRSLRSRSQTTLASTTDTGVPIDTLVIAKMNSLTSLERSKTIGLIEPRDGRFWLVFSDEIYVLSVFEGSKVSAWSTYNPTADVASVPTAFTIDDAVAFRRRVYVRSGNTIYVYGGLADQPVYDNTSPEFWTPYLDANTPTEKKMMTGIDAAVEGVWEIRVGMEPNNIAASDKVGQITATTYNGPRIPAEGEATHFSLRFKGVGIGPRKVGSAVIHYEKEDTGDDADN